VNCNQELCIELSSAINFHREIEPANLLQYIINIVRLIYENLSCLKAQHTNYNYNVAY
jgi:hypothetical protein